MANAPPRPVLTLAPAQGQLGRWEAVNGLWQALERVQRGSWGRRNRHLAQLAVAECVQTVVEAYGLPPATEVGYPFEIQKDDGLRVLVLTPSRGGYVARAALMTEANDRGLVQRRAGGFELIPPLHRDRSLAYHIATLHQMGSGRWPISSIDL